MHPATISVFGTTLKHDKTEYTCHMTPRQVLQQSRMWVCSHGQDM